MPRLSVILLLSTVLITLECCNKKNETPPTIPDNTSEGTIIFPAGMNTNTTGWKVNYGTKSTEITNGKFSIGDTAGDFSLNFVEDASGKEVFIGINYPTQTDFSIGSKSTAVALILKAPAVTSLSAEGKVALIEGLQTSSQITPVVEEIDNIISSGKSVLDTTNTSLHNLLASLFHEVSLGTLGTIHHSNVRIFMDGKDLIFSNPGVLFNQVISVRRSDGSGFKKMDLPKYQFLVKSISEIPSVINGVEALNPLEVKYSLPGPGQYVIKVNSGRPFSGINGPEHDEALRSNMIEFATDIVGSFLPLKYECAVEVRKFVSQAYDDVRASGNYTEINRAGIVLLAIANNSIGLMNTAAECFVPEGDDVVSKFWTFTKRVVNVVSLYGRLNFVVNNSVGMTQYYAYPSQFDTCVALNSENLIVACDDSTEYWRKRVIGIWKVREYNQFNDKGWQVIQEFYPDSAQSEWSDYITKEANQTIRYTSWYDATVNEDYSMSFTYNQTFDSAHTESGVSNWSVSRYGYFSPNFWGFNIYAGQIVEPTPGQGAFRVHGVITNDPNVVDAWTTWE